VVNGADLLNTETEFLDREYNPRTQVPNFGEFFARWKQSARETRESLPGRLDLSYGTSAAEALDFFPAHGPARPVLIFLHGGYWRALNKADFSWIAPKYVDAGISVAIVNYGLAPANPLREIVQQVRRACVRIYRNASELGINRAALFCAGHSAGGHLTAMMLATHWPDIAQELPRRLLRGALTISGLFDLAPLTHAEFLRHDLQLDLVTAQELSPAFLQWHNDVPLIRTVGALESGEFHRQSEMIQRH
jgi:arylformamidase